MKTSLDITEQLLADAKALAAQQRTSRSCLIVESLQLRVRATPQSAKRGRVRPPVFKGRGGLVEGAKPLSNKAVLEALGASGAVAFIDALLTSPSCVARALLLGRRCRLGFLSFVDGIPGAPGRAQRPVNARGVQTCRISTVS